METALVLPDPLLPPLGRFALGMMLIFTIPMLCKRLSLPPVVGFIVAGFLVGPHFSGLAPRNAEVAEFLAEIGKLLLMFFAGLEIDLTLFRRIRHRALIFGVLSFALPCLAGVAAGQAFGYPLAGALVIGSLLGSHTLIAFGIVDRADQLQNEAVAVTIGATVFTDLAALMVLALCIPVHTTGFSLTGFAIQFAELAVLVPAIIFGIGWISRKLMAFAGSEGGQFAVLMSMVALAALGAEMINLEGIIGAFLAGLALNTAAKGTVAKEHLEFIGNHFFIPIFFMTIGFLIDARTFVSTLASEAGFVLAIVAGLVGGKFLAAYIAGRTFGFTRDEGLTMWALSLPQVAATLAAALVANKTLNAASEPLVGDTVVNTVIVLLVLTSVLGPILTERFVKRLPPVATAGKPARAPARKPSGKPTRAVRRR